MDTPEPTWSFYDEYTTYPLSADDRTDQRHVARLRCSRETGDRRESFTITWTALRDNSAVIHLDAYLDGAVALAESGVCQLLARLEDGRGIADPLTVEEVTAALVAAGFTDRTNHDATSHCSNCGRDEYTGPSDVLGWRARMRRRHEHRHSTPTA